MSTKIILADDHQIVRDGLRALLEKQPGFKVVGEAKDGRAAVRLAKELSPDLVIMDLSMPQLNGIEASRKIIHDSPKIKIIVLSMHSDRRFVAEVLKAGASGYLLKDSAFEELITAIRRVMNHQTYLSSQVLDVVLKEYLRRQNKEDASQFSVLTDREREVLQLIAEGKISKEIAALLGVSVKTIETYRQRIMDKLEIRNIADLVKYAVRQGITSLEP